MVLVHTLTKLSLESPELIVENLLATKPVMVTSASGGTIKRSNKVASASAIFPEWEMSIDLKLEENKINTWSNVLALQVNHTKRTDGNLWRGIPAVYMSGGRNALHICSHVSNSWNHCWDSDDLGTKWFNLKVRQRKEVVEDFKPTFVRHEMQSNWVYNYEILRL